jgi:hypothetical protein
MLPVATMTAFIAVNVSYEPELTPAERIELAEHMIALWSQFKALAKERAKVNIEEIRVVIELILLMLMAAWQN